MEKISKDILNNTVKAEHQVKVNQHFFGDYKNPNSLKIMYIGNSITLHEKKPEIGWNFNHGMAASTSKKDYVHVTTKMLEKHYGKKIGALVYNGSDFERNFNDIFYTDKIVNQAKNFKADIIVIRIGENVYKKDLDFSSLEKAFINLVKKTRQISPKVLITSLFWSYPDFDDMLKRVAENQKIPYVYLADLGSLDENKAIGKFEHNGVANHPGDLGMKHIAERIFDCIKNNF